jgi:4-hydroxy-tetrahydrodipicolinate reductase
VTRHGSAGPQDDVRVAVIGLGALGLPLAHELAQGLHPGLSLVAAIDSDPAKVGCRLADLEAPPLPAATLLGVTAGSGAAGAAATARSAANLTVSSDLAGALTQSRAEVAVHTTGSHLPDVMAQLETCIAAGVSVVSSCEELSLPEYRHPKQAAQLDALARERGVSILGTGVNPGFVMDRLVLAASGACLRVEHVRVERVVDTARRRVPLQKKTGLGMTVAEFRQKAASGELGHVGLAESLALVARGLRMPLERLEETIDPVVATPAHSALAAGGAVTWTQLHTGQVAGLRQTATGVVGGVPRLQYTLEMSLGADDPHDRVVIRGVPALELVVPGGTAGDLATLGTLVRGIRPVRAAEPGLMTVADLPLFGLT